MSLINEGFVNDHSLWGCSLLKKLSSPDFKEEEAAFFFEQHYQYSRNFTKLLCLAASRMEDPLHRAIVVENLFEETGEEDVDKRHSELMCEFLRTIGVNTEALSVKPYTELYIKQCVEFLSQCDSIEAGAFLAWGTEGMVPKLYSLFVDALKTIGLSEKEYFYFSLHIECDDGHHDALVSICEDIYKKSSSDNDKMLMKNKIMATIDYALNLRTQFFDAIYKDLEESKLLSCFDTIHQQEFTGRIDEVSLSDSVNNSLPYLYENCRKLDNIHFKVQRTALQPEVIDPRVLTVEPHSRNENHLHAHESFFYILEGQGKAFVGDREIDLSPGTMLYVPRWVYHYTQNTSSEPLKVLAITDYGLTKNIPKNTEESYRLSPENLGEAALSA